MFIDQLLTNPHVEEGITQMDREKGLKEFLRRSTVITANHVSDFYFQSRSVEDWKNKDFPNIAPPFKDFFLEFQAPSQVYFKGSYMDWPENYPIKWGVYCHDFSKEISDSSFGEDKWTIPKNGWRVCVYLFMQFKGSAFQSRLGPYMSFYIDVHPSGCRTKRRWTEEAESVLCPYASDETHISLEPANYEDIWDKSFDHHVGIYGEKVFLSWMIEPALLAISFMHCKNVVLREETPPAVQQTPKQKRQRIQPHQPVTYHVLDIEPMKQVLKTEGKSDQVGLQRALHICRGHFSTYTEDHKLFGKYTGTFWIPQHVRGSAENGFATKDYRIKLDK